MKFLISAIIVAFSFITLSSAHAQRPLKMVTYDSLALDTLQTSQIVENPNNVLGFANNSNVALVNGSYFVLGQYYHGSSAPIEFQVGSKIEFYWTRASNDSSRAWFILRHYIDNQNGWINPDGPGDTAFVTQPKTTLPQMYTLTVQHAGYNTIEVWPDTTPGTKPVYIDAIVLLQHGTVDSTGNTADVNSAVAAANGFACYPNPFIATEGTTLRSTTDGAATYIVMDLIGREITSIDASSNAHITVPNSGTYFIRKRVGSEWSGTPLRVSAE